MLAVVALIVAVDYFTRLISKAIAHHLGSFLDASLLYPLNFDSEGFVAFSNLP